MLSFALLQLQTLVYLVGILYDNQHKEMDACKLEEKQYMVLNLFYP